MDNRTRGHSRKIKKTEASWISGNISFQNELSVDGIACLKMMSIKQMSTDSKGLCKEDDI